jgi:hypothetical protein
LLKWARRREATSSFSIQHSEALMAQNTSQTAGDSGTTATRPPIPFAIAEMTVRSATQLYDLQMNTLRGLAETHARTATAFGIPSWTDWFQNGSEEALRQAVRDAAEQVLQTSRGTAEAIAQLQGQFRELINAQSGAASQQWQTFIGQLGGQMTQSLEAVRSMAEAQARRVGEETEARVEAIANAMQQGVAGTLAASGITDAAGADDEQRPKGGQAPQINGARQRAASRPH